ncbi:protein phosphatase CheZ [Fontimonas thermophila]|nr:protein phosphatase CheZ [Fontimonas thermophila]
MAARHARMAHRLRELLAALESGDDSAFEAGIDALMRERQDGLFAQVARLTRDLHQAVVEMRMDERLARIAGHEIPDARHRLDYVVQMTERAAHRTLDLVDCARAVVRGIEEIAAHLAAAAALLERAQPDLAEVGRRMHDAHTQAVQHAAHLRTTLSELAEAQAYQDLSGQIIRRVIALVGKVETALLELLHRSSGGPGQPVDRLQSAANRPIQAQSGELAGPAVPGKDDAASQQDADELLARLGF